MTARFCEKHRTWACGYGTGPCQAESGAVADVRGSGAHGFEMGGAAGSAGLTGAIARTGGWRTCLPCGVNKHSHPAGLLLLPWCDCCQTYGPDEESV